jgi:hypothetical protein
VLEKLTSRAMESGGRRNLLASGARLLAKVGMIFNQIPVSGAAIR